MHNSFYFLDLTTFQSIVHNLLLCRNCFICILCIIVNNITFAFIMPDVLKIITLLLSAGMFPWINL